MKKLTMNELNRLSVNEFKSANKIPLIIILDNIRSQNNIGSIFRTADAFRAESVYLCGITATPPHREIHKTALGATESVNWKYFPTTLDAVKEVKSKGYKVLAIEQTHSGISLLDFKPEPEQGYGLIFGNEVEGIEEDVISFADLCVEIPQYGTKHSLNIAVSAGIILWDFFFKSGYFEKNVTIHEKNRTNKTEQNRMNHK